MPELDFRVTGVEPVAQGLAPLLQFKLEVTSRPGAEPVQALILQAQVQFQSPQRAYSPREKERLVELFGPPEAWGQTLRNRLWAQTQTTVGAFAGRTQTVLPVPCTYDLNILATKYFYALEDGDVPLLFLFSGSIFYLAPNGRLQVERISWNKECVYRLSLGVWQELMEHHFPNSAWLALRREAFDRLWAYKRRQGLATWEETVERLLRGVEADPLPLAALAEPGSEPVPNCALGTARAEGVAA